MKSYSDSYRESGVDITAGYKAVELMKSISQGPLRPLVFPASGDSAGFSLST